MESLCSQNFDPGLEQYLVLTEDEEVQEEENLMTDMFRCKDAGSSDEGTSSDESESSSKPKKKNTKKNTGKGKKSKGSKKKTKKQKKSKKPKKTKTDEDESEDPEKALIADLEKKIRKAIRGIYIWTLGIFVAAKTLQSHGYGFPCWQAIADVTKKIKSCNVELTKSAKW